MAQARRNENEEKGGTGSGSDSVNCGGSRDRFPDQADSKYTPSSEVMDSQEYFGLNSDDEAAVIVGSEVLSYKGKLIGDVAYVDYQAVKEVLNDYFYWDSDNNTMLYTMPTDVVQIPAGTSQLYRRWQDAGFDV